MEVRFKVLRGYAQIDCKGYPDLSTFTTDPTKAGSTYWKRVEIRVVCEYGSSSKTDEELMTDYDYNLQKSGSGASATYRTRVKYKSGSTRVYIDGVRATPNVNPSDQYDYKEIAPDRIQFNYEIPPNTNLTVEYIPA